MLIISKQLLSGFQRKSQKTPKREIERAERLMKKYYMEKQEYEN